MSCLRIQHNTMSSRSGLEPAPLEERGGERGGGGTETHFGRTFLFFALHMHSYYFTHESFCLETFSLPSPSWFA